MPSARYRNPQRLHHSLHPVERTGGTVLAQELILRAAEVLAELLERGGILLIAAEVGLQQG